MTMILEENSTDDVDDFIQETKPIVIENKDNGHQCEIAMAAYFKAERRGFASGHELDDWLEAEHDIIGSPK
jgi:hypothetical protein